MFAFASRHSHNLIYTMQNDYLYPSFPRKRGPSYCKRTPWHIVIEDSLFSQTKQTAMQGTAEGQLM